MKNNAKATQDKNIYKLKIKNQIYKILIDDMMLTIKKTNNFFIQMQIKSMQKKAPQKIKDRLDKNFSPTLPSEELIHNILHNQAAIFSNICTNPKEYQAAQKYAIKCITNIAISLYITGNENNPPDKKITHKITKALRKQYVKKLNNFNWNETELIQNIDKTKQIKLNKHQKELIKHKIMEEFIMYRLDKIPDVPKTMRQIVISTFKSVATQQNICATNIIPKTETGKNLQQIIHEPEKFLSSVIETEIKDKSLIHELQKYAIELYGDIIIYSYNKHNNPQKQQKDRDTTCITDPDKRKQNITMLAQNNVWHEDTLIDFAKNTKHERIKPLTIITNTTIEPLTQATLEK